MNPQGARPDRPRDAHEHAVFVLTAAQSREVDRLALAEYGLSGLVLMENAARETAGVALGMVADTGLSRVVVLAGPGNNGGDGLGAARHLHNAGVEVEVLLAYPAAQCRGDCAVQLATVQRMGIAVREWAAAPPQGPGLVVDALFGTGLSRPLDAVARACVAGVNGASAGGGCRVLSVDVPSGMDADTGSAPGGGPVVRADVTVTFAGMKPGLLAARALAGRVVVRDIGVPRELIERLGTRLRADP